jgi:hypothetical protein
MGARGPGSEAVVRARGLLSCRTVAYGAVVSLVVSLAACDQTTTIGGSYAPGVGLIPSAPPGPAGDAYRIAIHSSSQQDIASVLKSNGVHNPGRWAQIVIAYQPYPANDPSLAMLQRALTQYHADPDTIAEITNALTP